MSKAVGRGTVGAPVEIDLGTGETPAPPSSGAPPEAGRDSREARNPRDTPAMRQYARFKAQHPECVLFFRMGDFYEMFDDDALMCHKVLGLTLTQRTAGIPMAGVPYHAVEGYLRRMIQAGYRVAVCEQIEDPKDAVGVVDRSVTRVLTPGTLVDEALLDEGQANTIAAIQFLEAGERSGAVVALAELSTGKFELIELDGERVLDEVARLRPAELLYVETADGAAPPRVKSIASAVGCALTARPAWTFRLSDARDLLREHFGVAKLDGFGLEDGDGAVGPAGALLRYLQETQAGAERETRPDEPSPRPSPLRAKGEGEEPSPQPSPRGRGSLVHLRPPRKRATDRFVMIDASSLRSLEIERTMRSGQVDGSLISVLNRCRTSMGRRLLREWLCFPLRDLEEITSRQRRVGAFAQEAELAAGLGEQVEGMQDVARIVGRVATRRATPRDLVALGRSVARISAVVELMEARPAFAESHRRLAELAGPLAPLAKSIVERCVDDPPAHMREGGLLRDGVDAELDESRGLQRDANQWLAKYQKQLIDQTNINSLKVGFNNVFGYYIEVTHANVEKVPATFSRKQTLKNAERYITPELKEFEDKVTTAQARAIEREKILFEKLCMQTARLAGALSEYATIMAELDVLACFAEAARRNLYVRPQMVSEAVLELRQGRHPVLDRMMGERFVPNDCGLGRGRSDGATKRRSDEGKGGASEPEPLSTVA
ncbi:MAG: DNA mismatch repair protein MutS, partial [Phycisphaerales bacterium]|nr:DNA mismatch repair protein MutS [Phycisphaerales bacterium]